MKTSAFSVLLVVYATMSFAYQLPEPESLKCRIAVREINYAVGNVQRIENDLIHGIWTLKSLNSKLIFQFKDFGMLDLIELKETGNTAYKNALWQVEEINGRAVLVITEKDMRQRRQFGVEQTCLGVVLKDQESLEELKLIHQSASNSMKINLMKANLVGDWTNVTYPFNLATELDQCGTFEEMKGAFLRYRFNPDGTFQLTYGSSMMTVRESGCWELGINGEYVLLHVTEKNGVKQPAETKLAKIVYVGDHELLMEQSLLTSGEFSDFFCTDQKTFTFVK